MTSKQLTLNLFFTTNDEVAIEESHLKQPKWSSKLPKLVNLKLILTNLSEFSQIKDRCK